MKFLRWLKKELLEVIPVTLFFFVGCLARLLVRPWLLAPRPARADEGWIGGDGAV